jgi:hypothetical protein
MLRLIEKSVVILIARKPSSRPFGPESEPSRHGLRLPTATDRVPLVSPAIDYRRSGAEGDTYLVSRVSFTVCPSTYGML